MQGGIVRAVSLCLCTGCGAATEPTIADATGLDASTAGDGDHSESQVEGTVGGQVFSSEGALGIVEAPPGSDSPVPALVTLALLANYTATCAQLNESCRLDTVQANTAALAVYLSTAGTPLAVGSYAVPSSPSDTSVTVTASGYYSAFDGNCAATLREWATGGSVTVTAIDVSAISGYLDIVFPNGDRVSGRFAAPFCFVGGACGGTGVTPRPSTCLR